MCLVIYRVAVCIGMAAYLFVLDALADAVPRLFASSGLQIAIEFLLEGARRLEIERNPMFFCIKCVRRPCGEPGLCDGSGLCAFHLGRVLHCLVLAAHWNG